MKIAIIGGGASGLAAAIEASLKARERKIKADITVFEAKDRIGKKLLATGNGRCNMTNLNDNIRYFGDCEFASAVLKKFSVQSNLKFFSDMGLFTKSDEEGRVYPLSNQASGVLDALRFECERLGVKFVTEYEIKTITAKGNTFLLNGKEGYNKVILACGSAAQVKSFNGYDLLKSLGHTVTRLAPSLTKLTVADSQKLRVLKGIRHRCDLTLYIEGKLITKEKGELLFADYGLSGIAVMQLSSFVARHFMYNKSMPKVKIDLVPDYSADFISETLFAMVKRNPEGSAGNLLLGFMPKKVGEAVMKDCGIKKDSPMKSLRERDVFKLSQTVKAWELEINGTKDFSDAQVVSGGADCKEFYSDTLMSKKHKGLYCCGELLDVDGPCGGYNLQWAWSSGRLCGESVITGDIK
ncbi:MAG: aminoacetone oxidase family FAD-binding enzyme [Clostridia bacterium]|nr:aminoacetone oxidase family FAD-binding enzyme [Clostridia bacterium]